MRVRILELRIIAGALAALWATAAALVLVGYHPGGPIDVLVGLTACLAIPIPLVALVWPPAARGIRAFAVIVWLGLAAALLLVPSIGGLLEQLRAGGPQTLLPSLETTYPWLLALIATSLFAGLGLARRILGETALRRDRLLRGGVIGLAATLLVGSAFAGAAIANDLALRDAAMSFSRFGPAGTAHDPPRCDGPIAPGRTARLGVDLSGDVDGHSIGSAGIDGLRLGPSFRWTADVATDRALGLFGTARVGNMAATLAPRSAWIAVPPEVVAGNTLDLQVLGTVLTSDARRASEDRGLEYVEGALSRHCRIAVAGPAFALAFPEVDWLAGDADLHRWRGQLDFWIFADGQLGRVDGFVSGPASAIGASGVQSTLRATMIAVDRDQPMTLTLPHT